MILLRRETLIALHERHQQDWPTASGLRDESVLADLLARAGRRPTLDLWTVAAGYGHGIVSRRPFDGGDKHAAFGAVAVFLDLNGLELAASSLDLIGLFIDLEAGELDENGLADWLRHHARPSAIARTLSRRDARRIPPPACGGEGAGGGA